MSRPFRRINPQELPDLHRPAALALEDHFDRLEHFFHSNLGSSKRLKRAPDENITVGSALRELAGLYALRSLELTEGAILLIEDRNPAAAMPLGRSLLEVWMAIRFVKTEFSKHLDKGKPERFEDTIRRLLVGRSGGPPNSPRPPISIKKIRGIALESARDEPLDTPEGPSTLAREMSRLYDQLSDASHPSQWSMMPYYQDRTDDLGNDWLRKPKQMPDLYALSLINIPFGYIRFELTDLLTLADRADAVDSS